MSASAIVMICIACIGLWGGIAVSLTIMMKANKRRALQAVADGVKAQKESVLEEWGDAELMPDQEERRKEILEKELEKYNKK